MQNKMLAAGSDHLGIRSSGHWPGSVSTIRPHCIHPSIRNLHLDLESEGDFDLHKEMIQIDSIGLIDTSQATETSNTSSTNS